MKKKVYWDMHENEGCAAIITNDVDVVPSGTTLYPMSVKSKNEEYQKYADKYDLRFIFDNEIPQIDFYTVPQVDIFAKDSMGGLFGTVGQTTSISDVAPICYITKNKECFFVADSLKDFLQILVSDGEWKTNMVPNKDIEFYKSKADAASSLEFIEIHQEINSNSDC